MCDSLKLKNCCLKQFKTVVKNDLIRQSASRNHNLAQHVLDPNYGRHERELLRFI